MNYLSAAEATSEETKSQGHLLTALPTSGSSLKGDLGGTSIHHNTGNKLCPKSKGVNILVND